MYQCSPSIPVAFLASYDADHIDNTALRPHFQQSRHPRSLVHWGKVRRYPGGWGDLFAL